MPFKWRPGMFKSRGQVAPVDTNTASYCCSKWAESTSLPTSTFGLNSMPSWVIRSTRLCTTSLESFMDGMP
ncbi:hypothetical protein BpHYR1_037195 [Brachionus plicatilis]|uniref:Uncharacterized protein n=1 Tax=Brachionus plicatilis TaxID=10195 RepID=A0A3M7SIH9_BRAPC|nr:hypothetical protein BpHYR1_037195 [Brachionus plicatilis]